MLLRQLPIEGIHTKWLTRHATLVLALLGDDHTPAAGDTNPDDLDDLQQLDAVRDHTKDDDTEDDGGGASRRRLLHARLGLRVPPDLVQVSVCDPQLRAQVGGMRHFAASVEDLNGWQTHPTAVAILENKETGYAVTEDLPGAVILHGHGRYIEQYARITWVRTAKQVVYWGDLDVPGLQFISDLRAHGIPATTILTDQATLERYRSLAVPGPAPRATAIPPHLTAPELQLYQLLIEHARADGTGLLLEQERIPWSTAAAELRVAVTGSPVEPR